MKTDQYQEITNKVIEKLESCNGNWIKPFQSLASMPENAKTHNEYHGINVLILGLSGYSSPYWASYDQWRSKGCQVRRGERGTGIVFFKPLTKEKDGETVSFAVMRYSSVFNSDQVGGFVMPDQDQIDETETLAHVDQYIENTGAVFVPGNPAYVPSQDHIRMLDRSAFSDGEDSTATETYYSTILHELTHWTGHKSRCDRFSEKNRRGYAFEELIAELGATFQCVKLGISPSVRADHAQYLANWLQALKSDKKYIFQAAKEAQKAVDFLASITEQKDIAA